MIIQKTRDDKIKKKKQNEFRIRKNTRRKRGNDENVGGALKRRFFISHS
jgi:hypothetical protein